MHMLAQGQGADTGVPRMYVALRMPHSSPTVRALAAAAAYDPRVDGRERPPPAHRPVLRRATPEARRLQAWRSAHARRIYCHIGVWSWTFGHVSIHQLGMPA